MLNFYFSKIIITITEINNYTKYLKQNTNYSLLSRFQIRFTSLCCRRRQTFCDDALHGDGVLSDLEEFADEALVSVEGMFDSREQLLHGL